MSQGNPKLMRAGVVLVLLAVVVPAILIAVRATGLSFAGAVPVTAAVCLVGMLLFARVLPAELSPDGKTQRVWFAVWCVLSLLAAFQTAQLGFFMGDVKQVDHAFQPKIRTMDDPEMEKPFHPKHNCFTGYVVGAHLASQRVDNLYGSEYYRNAEIPTPIHDQIGDSFTVDNYQYPPPFLLLPRLLQTSGDDFYQFRSYWFGINVVTFALITIALALWIGPRPFNRYFLALPLVLLTPAMLCTLQIQNAHLWIIGIAMVSLVAFARGWHGLGGALLGFAIVSKLFPGLLLVFLLLQRRWRSVFWTGGWMVAFCLATLALFGPRPFEAFVDYQMPRLASGEAFAFATTLLTPIVKNGSIMGIPYKLEKLGLVSDPAALAGILKWAYSAILLLVLLIVGVRRFDWRACPDPQNNSMPRRLMLARVWLVLLILGQLRAPFLPWEYGNIAPLLLLTLLIPVRGSRTYRAFVTTLLVPAWIILAVIVPLAFGPPSFFPDIIHTLSALFMILVCCTVVIVGSRNAMADQTA